MRATAGRTPSRRATGKLSGGRDEHGWPQARMVIMTALQRQLAYRVAVVNRRHAGLFAVAGDRIDTVAQPAAAGVRSPRYGGWYGLESHRVNERIAELAHRHFRDIVGILAQAIRSGQKRLVVGGHADAISQFLTILPPDPSPSVRVTASSSGAWAPRGLPVTYAWLASSARLLNSLPS
jgi:Bacterial archaeo-eukaryotic release factor family 10